MRGFIDDQSVALVCAAALFEDFAAGWAAGIEIIDNVFTMVLPGILYVFLPFPIFIMVDSSRGLYFLLLT